MVWYGMVWYGMIWYDTVRYGAVRCGTVYRSTVRLFGLYIGWNGGWLSCGEVTLLSLQVTIKTNILAELKHQTLLTHLSLTINQNTRQSVRGKEAELRKISTSNQLQYLGN